MKKSQNAEIAAAAARLVVEEGLDYGPAKRKAARAQAGPASDVDGNKDTKKRPTKRPPKDKAPWMRSPCLYGHSAVGALSSTTNRRFCRSNSSMSS